MSERPCSKCGTSFLPSAAQVRRGSYHCRPCRSAYQAVWARRRRAEGLLPPAPYNAEYQRTTYKRLRATPEGRQRVDARTNTRRAIREGLLVRQPCERCGAAPAEAHHDDYSQWRNVRWLCPTHHREHHAQERAAQRA